MGFALTHVRYTVGNGGSPDHAFYRVTTNRSCFMFDMTNSSKTTAKQLGNCVYLCEDLAVVNANNGASHLGDDDLV